MEKRFDLIQQLQQTPKWEEFERWYKNRYMTIGSEVVNNALFKHKIKYQHIDEWKGVFEKFIGRNDETVFEQTANINSVTYSIWTLETSFIKKKSFEELLLWYFNN